MDKERILRRSKRMLLWSAAALVVLAMAGRIYQAVATVIDRRKYPPPGQMIDVGGRRLHLQVSGENSGGPTVILEAGMASFSSNWVWVQEELSTVTRVVSYDRAGLGWSDPPSEAQDAYESAADLHLALQNAGISGPYVLAGHSYGGLVVRAFTDLYQDEVVGMVLVDGSHPDQWAHIPASRNGKLNATMNRITGWLGRIGIVRLFNLERSVTEGLPEQQAAEMKAILSQPRSWAMSAGTLSAWPDRTTPRINAAAPLGDLPLIILGVTEQAFYGEVLTDLQAELPSLSSNSRLQIVEGATHEGLIGRKPYAAIVSAAIWQVLEAVQSGRTLAQVSSSVTGP